MPSYAYSARNPRGELQTGIVEAGSKESAADILLRHGLGVMSIQEAKAAPLFERQLKLFSGVPKKDLVVFSRQLAVLVEAQVPLLESLHTLAEQASNPTLARTIVAIEADVDSGSSFSEALARHPKIFSQFYMNLVKSGEVSGKLQDVLSYLADHLEREYAIVSKVRGAMLYPAVILVAMIAVVIILVTVVIPSLQVVFEEAGVQLPFLTRMVIGSSNMLRNFWWLWLGVLATSVYFFRSFTKAGKGKLWWDTQRLRAPVFGRLLKSFYIARFSENLETLITAGLPIATAIEISAEVVGNLVYRGILLSARDAVRRGEMINPEFSGHWAVPPMVAQMISIGERTGRVDQLLGHISRFFRREVETAVDNLTSIIEPLLIVVLGAGVGLLVASILMPIYNLASTFQ